MSNCKRYTEDELQQLLSDGIAELQQRLIDALERISNMDSMSYHSLESAKIVAREALASWRRNRVTMSIESTHD